MPDDFGFKINWFAIKTTDSQAVVDALNLGPARVANWRTGLQAAYSSRFKGYKDEYVFVTPAVEGWVLMVGVSLPYPVMHSVDRHNGIGQAFDVLFERLGKVFSEVQFFGNYRVVGFVAWALMKDGNIERIFSMADELYANVGKQTVEEAALGLPRLDGLSLDEATSKMFEEETRHCREQDVLFLAEKWSINPGTLSFLESDPACGFVVPLSHIGEMK